MKSILQTCLSKRKIDCENFDEYVGFCEICQRKELKDMQCGNKNRPAAVTVKAQRVCAHVRAPMCGHPCVLRNGLLGIVMFYILLFQIVFLQYNSLSLHCILLSEYNDFWPSLLLESECFPLFIYLF